MLHFAVLAQLVEQRIRNAWVGGSSPLNGTIFLFKEFSYILRHYERVAQRILLAL